MKRLLSALLLCASPAFAQANGWQEIQNGWGEIQTATGGSTVPTGCVASSVPFFLGSPVAMGCDAGLTYRRGEVESIRSAGFTKPAGPTATLVGSTAGFSATPIDVSGTNHFAGFPGVTRASDGTLVLLAAYGVTNLSPDTQTHVTWRTTSSDGGATWTTPTEVYASGSASYGTESRQLITLLNGDLLAIGCYEDNSYLFYGAYTIRSTDKGATWVASTAVSDTLANRNGNGLTQLPNGTILASLRVDPARDVYLRQSTDNGVTWTTGATVWTGGTSMVMHNLQSLGGLDVLFIYSTTAGLYSRLSADGGATWAAPVTIATDSVTYMGSGVFANGRAMAFGASTTSGALAYYSSSDKGTTWTAAALLDNPGARTLSGMAGVETSPGQMFVTWAKRLSGSAYGDVKAKVLMAGFGVDALGGAVLSSVSTGTTRETSLPVYADNASALAGGLTAGDGYRTSTGVRMVTY